MESLRFLLLNTDGIPINHGVIAKQITPEKYLCQFSKVPAVARVCDITEIQGWNLFPTDKALNEFIAAIQKGKKLPAKSTPPTPPTPPKPPVEFKPGGQKPSHKKKKKRGKNNVKG